MQPTVHLNHNLLAVESEHTVHAMVELAARTDLALSELFGGIARAD